MRYAVGQLTVGQILDQSLSLFKNRPWLFLGISGIVYAPLLLLQAILMLVFVDQPVPGASPEDVVAGSMESATMLMFIGIGFMVIYFLLSGPLLSAAVTYAVSKEYVDQEITVKESLRMAFSKLWPVLYTGFLSGILIILGFVLCFVPGIYLMFKYYLVQQVVVLEDKRGVEALKRSGELMKGSFGIAFVLGFLAWIVTMMTGAIGAFIPVPGLSELVNVAIQTAVVTLWLIAAVVLYFHCRARTESYDLQLLAESVGAEDTQNSPVPPPLPNAD